jgi:hypothetical protein
MFKWLTQKSFNQTEIEILNFGLEVSTRYIQFQPTQAQLQEQFPVLTSKERDRYIKICRNALKFGLNEVYKLVNKKGTSLVVNDLKPMMLKKYPWVNEKNIGGMISMGIYITQK